MWIYWFGDASAIAPQAFLAQVTLGLEVGMLSRSAGWDEEAARGAIEDGTPAPPGMAPLHQTVHGLPPQIAAVLASQETIGAITIASLAAWNEGLGTCLLIPAAPASAGDALRGARGSGPLRPRLAPAPRLPGRVARRPAGSGPAMGSSRCSPSGRWGRPLARDAGVVEDLEREGLIQAPAPLPGRAEELEALARMFGYPAA